MSSDLPKSFAVNSWILQMISWLER